MSDDEQQPQDLPEQPGTQDFGEQSQVFGGQERETAPSLVLSLGPKNIEGEMRGKVHEALQQPMIPKDLEYMLIPTIMPNQQGAPMPAFALALALKSPLLTADGPQMIQATAILPSPWLPQEDVSEVVRQLSESLLQARSQQSLTEVARTAISPNGIPPKE